MTRTADPAHRRARYENKPRIRARAQLQGETMTAVPYCDELTTSPATKLTLAPSRRSPQPPIGAGDPMLHAAAGLLSIPLRHMYAALWRVGMIEITS
jgi:hypothetical protein